MIHRLHIGIDAVLMLILAMSFIGLQSCKNELSCSEHEHIYNDRCVCDSGYEREGGKCVPVEHEDGDKDMDESKEESSEFEAEPMTHEGTCDDPQPLQLEVPIHADLSESVNHFSPEQDCNRVMAEFEWNGPDHVYTFEFTEDILADGNTFKVNVQPDSGVYMTYMIAYFFDPSRELDELCGADPTEYCLAQTAYKQKSGFAAHLPIGAEVSPVQAGDIAYIIVDSRAASDEHGIPGGYTIEVTRYTPEPADGDEDSEIEEECDECYEGEALEEELYEQDEIEEDAEIESEGEQAEQTEMEEEQTWPEAPELAVKNTYYITNANMDMPLIDMAWKNITGTATDGMHFGAIQAIPSSGGSAYYITEAFTGNFNDLSKHEMNSYVLGGIAITNGGGFVYAINVDSNASAELSRTIIGLASNIHYPEGLNTTTAITLMGESRIWATGDHKIWDITSQQAFSSYELNGYPSNLDGITIYSDSELLILANDSDLEGSYIVLVQVNRPFVGQDAVFVPFQLNAISYDRYNHRLWGASKDVQSHGMLIEFKCLPFDANCTD